MTSEIPYEEQFFLVAQTVYFYTEDGKRLRGWNKDQTFYACGRPVWNRSHCESRLKHMDGLRIGIEESEFYYIYDAEGVPIGSARDKPMATLTKKGIAFPRICHFNGYEWWEHADKALRQLKHYYYSIRTQCKIRKSETELLRILRPITLSIRAMELQDLNSGLIDRARKISNLSPLERMVLEEQGRLREPGSIL